MQKASKSQQQAIEHGEGPMLVMAGPGSGKTFVIIQRILYLIKHRNVSPEKILVISFSRASARELKERFQNKSKEKDFAVNFSTFHAFFFSILKETYHYTSQDIILNTEKRRLLRIILYDPVYNPVTDTENYIPPDRVDEVIEELLSRISYYKNRGMSEMNKKESSWFISIFHGYNHLMHDKHKLDFDDMGLLCLRLFQNSKKVLAKWQQQFKYILIDEFQDINEIQFRNIYLLCRLYQNIFVVGDDDQSIYRFRGSSPGFMLEFQKYYAQTKTVLLEINFRCSGNIVKRSLEVIEENKYRLPKDIKANKDMGEEVIIKDFINQYQEYEYLTERIMEYTKTGGHLEDIACIFRTNSQMMFLADVFMRKKIPFSMKETSRSIFQHFIAKDIFHYLRFFKDGKKRKDFFAIMNKPLRYLSRNSCNSEVISWSDMYKYYDGKSYILSKLEKLEQMEKWMNKLDLYGAISYLRKAGEYETYLKEYCNRNNILLEEAFDILENVHNSTRDIISVAGWEKEIEEYEKSIAESEKNSRGVRFMTMHGCKGLEFPYVFLPDCNEGKIPHNKVASTEEVEEERRMFYVAMTRAMDKLEILYLKDKSNKTLPGSRFLNPLCDKKKYV